MKSSTQKGFAGVLDLPKMSLEHALLSEDPLYCLDLNVGYQTERQRLFHLMFAALFEVSSGAVSYLFVRFDREEIERVRRGYQELGAYRICGGIEKLTGFIEQRIGAKYPYEDLFVLMNEPEFERFSSAVDKDFPMIALEMEERLLVHVKKHISGLK